MDRIVKYLCKLQPKIQQMLKKEIVDILAGELSGKDVKPLSGMPNYFRVRKGHFRIIFKKEGGKISIMRVAPRDNQTYHKL